MYYNPYGANSAGLSGISLFSNDGFSAHNNPAQLTLRKSLQASLWAERPFNISNLTQGAIGIAIPLKNYGFLGATYFSNSNTIYFQTRTATLGYGLKLSDNVSIGVQTAHHHWISAQYFNTYQISGGLSLLYHKPKSHEVSFQLRTPFTKPSDELYFATPQTLIRAGVKKNIYSDEFTILAELEKQSINPIRAKIGFLYRPKDDLVFCLGVSNLPNNQKIPMLRFAFGAHFKFHQINVSAALTFHPYLGFSPNTQLSYDAKEPQEPVQVD